MASPWRPWSRRTDCSPARTPFSCACAGVRPTRMNLRISAMRGRIPTWKWWAADLGLKLPPPSALSAQLCSLFLILRLLLSVPPFFLPHRFRRPHFAESHRDLSTCQSVSLCVLYRKIAVVLLPWPPDALCRPAPPLAAAARQDKRCKRFLKSR